MTQDQLLDTCLHITGQYEGGAPSYDTLAGGGDGEGLSAGICQWAAGQGTLQKLVHDIGEAMGWANAQKFFKSDIKLFSMLSPADAVSFAKLHYLDSAHPRHVANAARIAWQAFLNTPESIAAQRNLATTTILARAQAEAAKYTPDHAASTRAIACFFDLCTQQGSMNGIAAGTYTTTDALALAEASDPACAAIWKPILGADPLAEQLLALAWQRARQARSEYVWTCLARRGTIACRKGIANRTHYDFTALLD